MMGVQPLTSIFRINGDKMIHKISDIRVQGPKAASVPARK